MLANFETPSRVKMPRVWGRRSSFNVQKVMWLVGELSLPHACAAHSVPRARHDPVRGIARAAYRLMEGAHFVVATPASLITFAHFSISALIKLPKYSGVPPISLAP